MKLVLALFLFQSALAIAQDCEHCGNGGRVRGAPRSTNVEETLGTLGRINEQTIGAVRSHLCGLSPNMLTFVSSAGVENCFRGDSSNEREQRLTDFIRTIYYLSPNHQGRPALDPANYDHWLQFINNWNQIQAQLYCPAFNGSEGRNNNGGNEHILKQFTQEGRLTLVTEVFSKNFAIKKINTIPELLNGRDPLPRFNLESNCHYFENSCMDENYASYINRVRPVGSSSGNPSNDTALRFIRNSLNDSVNPVCMKKRENWITGNITSRLCAE